ncbi:hypothetical protein RHMOL_Rhmol08G0163300 [Rhododendron molle]|uniref:Uncharacterized protein n=1 Tax=Rhododendron molle TaxID=49168 RepID=A0ACC0MPC5_RHOML|nr:hypothetical protein RHMOL_Rhmol08G0163300 [Rhododendron molle]
MYPPETSCPDNGILPRALRWSKEYQGVKKGKGNLNAYHLFLDELRPDQSFGIRAAWDTTQQAHNGRGGRGGRRGNGGRGGGGHGDGAGQSGARLPALVWTVDAVTAQGVLCLVEVTHPTFEPMEFLAQVTPEYGKEMAAAMMGLVQLVQQYAMGHPPPVQTRVGGRMAQQAFLVGSWEERPLKRQQHFGTEEEPIAVSDETEKPTDIDLEDTSGSTVPRVTCTQEVSSSEAEEEGKDGGKDED